MFLDVDLYIEIIMVSCILHWTCLKTEISNSGYDKEFKKRLRS